MTWIQTGSTICFKPYRLEEALLGLAEAGFENVEIGAVKGFLEHLDPDDLGPDEIRKCAAALDRHGLRCVSITGHAQLHTEDGKRSVREPAGRAGAAATRLCIETDSNLMPTAEVGLRLLEEIGPPWIQINYDPGNVVYYTGAKPEDDLELALRRIGH